MYGCTEYVLPLFTNVIVDVEELRQSSNTGDSFKQTIGKSFNHSSSFKI
jgi:hypothetical protein